MRWHLLLLLTSLSGCADTPTPPKDHSLQVAVSKGSWPPQSVALAATKTAPINTATILRAIGPYEYNAKASYDYKGSSAIKHTANEDVSLKVAGDGGYVLYRKRSYERPGENTGDRKLAAIFDGQNLYTKLDNADWVMRNRLSRDHEHMHQQMMQHVPMFLALLSQYAVKRKEGRKVVLSLSPSRKDIAINALALEAAQWSDGEKWLSWWTHVHQITAIEGELEMHATQDIIIRSRIAFSADVSSKNSQLAAPNNNSGLNGTTNVPATFHGKITTRIRPISGPFQVSAPSDNVTPPKKSRRHHMIKTINDGDKP